ncbi:MAG: zinc-ribbon domain-containing protein, partial [Clostridium saudiense]|nr:zinc-ribbon domain-containing protein [Clostridium saudiense]
MFFIGIFGIDNKFKEIKVLNNFSCKNCNISN